MIGSRNKLGQIIGEKPIIKKCEVCGKEFKVYLSMIKRGRGKFCSKKCFSINNSKKMKGEPSRSKGKHWKMSEEIKKRLKGRNKGKHLAPQTEFKSGKNHWNWKGGPRESVCKMCNIKFLSFPSQNRVYCSSKCAGRGEMGINNYNWIEDRAQLKTYGDGEERRSPKYKDWSKRVKDRDIWKCRINNKDCSGKVIAHHILSWSEFPELRYNINNGITLCLAHHPRKRAEEKRLIPFFMGLVPVSKEKIWQIM